MAKSGYWSSFFTAVRTLSTGLRLTWSHLIKARRNKPVFNIQQGDYFQHQTGIATVQYPHVQLTVPDNGRYQLYNEIEDCIVCDKCAKVCPVDCIDIEPIKSPEEFGKTSDGTPKRIYAAKFDIDMGKCCFCGLCTTVCPTECLTMTKEYDFSVLDIREHTFVFGTMTTEEISAKQKAWEAHVATKVVAPASSFPSATSGAPKPVFKPRIPPPPAS